MDETVDMAMPAGSGYSTIRYHRNNLYSAGVSLPMLGTNTVSDPTVHDVSFNGDTTMYAITVAADPPEPDLWGGGANEKCGHSVSLSGDGSLLAVGVLMSLFYVELFLSTASCKAQQRRCRLILPGLS